MPNRIIKESICASEEIDALPPTAEVLFYRLIVIVDDFGRHDARLKLIASKCYPLKSIDIKSLQGDLACLQDVGLVRLYEVEGRPFLCLPSWSKHQQIRAKRPKYPGPDDGSDIACNQVLADVHVIQSNPIHIAHKSAQAKKPRFSAKVYLAGLGVDEDRIAEWEAIQKAKRVQLTKTAIAKIEREAEKANLTLPAVVELCCENTWARFQASWLENLDGKPARSAAMAGDL